MSEIYVSKEHFTGKPDCSGRTDKEARVYDLLDQLHIPYEGVDHDVAPTIEACRAVEEELGILPARICFCATDKRPHFFFFSCPEKKSFSQKTCLRNWASHAFPLRSRNLWSSIWDLHPVQSVCSDL